MKKLTREESKNILMSTIGSDMLGCYNDEQTSCVYYSPDTGSFCAIGMLMSEIDPKFAANGFVDDIHINGEVNYGGLSWSSDEGAITELTKHTGLSTSELRELQKLHDGSIGNENDTSCYLKYETFVAKL